MFLFRSFQVFRQLERPAELERLQYLKGVVKTHREKFITTILNNTDVLNLDELLAKELAKYEVVSTARRPKIPKSVVSSERMNVLLA